MDRISHFRRHKKAAATATAATAAAAGSTPTGTMVRASTEPTTSTLPAEKTSTPKTATIAASDFAVQASDDTASIHPGSHIIPPFSPFRRARRSSPQPATGPVQGQDVIRTQQSSRPSRSSRSPFRDLLRPSTKRSRESPPGNAVTPVSQPESPTTALNTRFQSIVLPVKAGISRLSTQKGQLTLDRPAQDRKPKLPPFLDISLEEIDRRFQKILWHEHSRLKESIVAPAGQWARVTGSHLRVLDRYANIQPWDRNRVRLQVPPGRVDYINASPIVLTTTAAAAAARPPDRYIAMQGPKKSSVDHVWRMVYEQLRSPAVIVMLTETHEGSMEKCYPYYPQQPDDPPMLINQHDEFGDGFRASVRCAAVEELLDGAIEQRRILLRIHHKAVNPKSRVPSPATVTAGGETAAKSLPDTDGGETAVPAAAAVANGGSDDLGSSSGSAAGLSSSSVSSPVGPETDMDLEVAMGSPEIDYEDYEDERIVYHFLYKKWPDFGVPALADVDSFFALMRLSAEKNADVDNPRIVHCSAGVGRSGTFIALEHLVRELDAGVLENCDSADEAGRLDEVEQGDRNAGETEFASEAGECAAEADDLIFTTVNQLREQRRTMVQADSQYHFIYQVLRKLWLEKYGLGDGDGDAEEMQGLEESTGPGDEDDDVASSEPAPKRLEVDPFVA
ncbi:protein-tyrosine phosphatase 2 [Grosmannia clavigera kw1407]|uniref:Protein-tyrosine phosphatase 2 n=1 Tax=Grosmannia clavigera (strain kw1407 / UAMH 11150) TaxID=655863 RepID=F0XN98_GROCL|nr:protein-tyrosine phosphatase 2 [Grosmannia clavigera kw1407]EFX00972.1 protein-tyrosine phosphatase 2 [Grosmannia clavigera kw1407]